MQRQKIPDSRRRMLPLLMDLEDRMVVIFGGGSVGERKARLFSGYCRVNVVSRDFTEGLTALQAKAPRLSLTTADLSCGFDKYLSGAFVAVPATSDRDLNRSIAQEAQRQGILVNGVDSAGDVVVPSIIERDPITIAIATESPGLTKYLRLRLEALLTENFQDMARLLGEIREEMKKTVPLQRDRARIIWSILEDEEVWSLLGVSYEKAYMKARSHELHDERDRLDAGNPPQGLHRRD